MLKQLSIAVISAGLLACGGGSSSGGSDGNGIGGEINPSLAGPVSAPQLSLINGDISDGSTIPLNTVVNTSIPAEGDQRFSFIADTDVQIAIILDGDDANDSDLDLSAAGVDRSGDAANEVLILQVDMGERIEISVESYNNFATNYNLSIVTANRQSLQLVENEYLVQVNERGAASCNDVEGFAFTGSYNEVVNFKSGYVRQLLDDERINATSVSENTLNFTGSVSESFDGDSFNSDWRLTYSVNTSTGATSGEFSSESVEVSDGVTESCSTTGTFTGQIIL